MTYCLPLQLSDALLHHRQVPLHHENETFLVELALVRAKRKATNREQVVRGGAVAETNLTMGLKRFWNWFDGGMWRSLKLLAAEVLA